MKALKDYKHNEEVLVLVLNPITKKMVSVDGIVRGAVIYNGKVIAVRVEFNRIWEVKMQPKYSSVGDGASTLIFNSYETIVVGKSVIEGIDNPDLISPKKKEPVKDNYPLGFITPAGNLIVREGEEKQLDSGTPRYHIDDDILGTWSLNFLMDTYVPIYDAKILEKYLKYKS